MKSLFFAVAIAASLAGCGTFYKPAAVGSVQCEGAQCTAMWQRVQTWIATHSRYRIQIANDSILQTFGPHENVYDGVAYTITKEASPAGKTQIVVRGSCYPTVYGCAIDPATYTQPLIQELQGLR